jgi:hypothetical protein
MADFTQAEVTLLPHQAITHPGNVIGDTVSGDTEGAFNVASYVGGIVTIYVANVETTANATGVAARLMWSGEANGKDFRQYQEWIGSTTAAETEALSDAGGEPGGETVLAVASTTNLAVGDWIYIRDDDSVAGGEWRRIVAVTTNTSVTIDTGLTAAKVQNDDIFDQAQVFPIPVQLEGVKRLRVDIVHQAATGSDIHVKALGTFATDIE